MAAKNSNSTIQPGGGNGILAPDGNEYVYGTNMDLVDKKPGGGSGFDDTVSNKYTIGYKGPADPVKGIEQPPTGSMPDGNTSTLPPSPGMDPLLGPDYVNRPRQETGYKANTREVQDNELVSSQLEGLLAGDSKYMKQARQEGLELGGGLGGTSGIRAAYGAAIKAGMPIAAADAQAFRDAASQNMDALNQFGLANIQRATQLDLGTMDANTRIKTTAMNNVAQTNIAKMQDITNRDIAKLDADTRLRVTEMNGQIQKRLADDAFVHSQFLNDQVHGNEMEQIALRGEYDLAGQAELVAAQDNTNYLNSYLGSYDSTLAQIAALNGIEMDDDARERANQAIWDGFDGMILLINALYPNAEPITFG